MKRLYVYFIYVVMTLVTAVLSAGLYSTNHSVWATIVFVGGAILTAAVYVDLVDTIE